MTMKQRVEAMEAWAFDDDNDPISWQVGKAVILLTFIGLPLFFSLAFTIVLTARVGWFMLRLAWAMLP